MKATGLMLTDMRNLVSPYFFENMLYALYNLGADTAFWNLPRNLSRADFRPVMLDLKKHGEFNVEDLFSRNEMSSKFTTLDASSLKDVIALLEDKEKGLTSQVVNKILNNQTSLQEQYEHTRPFVAQAFGKVYSLDDNVIKLLLKIYPKITKKDSHSITLRLILTGIQKELDKDLLLNAFHTFHKKNSSLNPSALGHMDKILEAIKDWPLANYFSLSDIKKFYEKTDALFSSKTIGVYYEFDVNDLKKKTKVDSKTITYNAINLFDSFPRALSSDPDFITCSVNKENHPLMSCHVSFSENVNPAKIEALKHYIEKNLIRSDKLDSKNIKQEIQTILLKSILNEKLSISEKPKTIRKI